MKKNELYWIKCHPFPIHMGLCIDEGTFRRACKKHMEGDELTHVEGKSWCSRYGAKTWWIPYAWEGGTTSIICISEYAQKQLRKNVENRAQAIGVLVHEITHVVQFLDDYVHDATERFDFETRAYLTEHLMRETFLALHQT